MAQELTAEQLEQVATAVAGGRYTRELWTAYVADAASKIAKTKKGLGGTEQDFPGVKPAHVRHMFRQVLRDNPELAKTVSVGVSKDHGVCLIPKAA